MKSIVGVVCLGLGCLLTAGCGCPARTGGDGRSETGRDAADEAARGQRFEVLIGDGKKALEAKRFDEAVKLFEEAARIRGDSQVPELLRQAHKARLSGLWVLSRLESGNNSIDVRGDAEGLLFDGDKVTTVKILRTGNRPAPEVAKVNSGSYNLDALKNPTAIDIRWGDSVQLGIYKLEKDTLTISCAEPGGNTRPQQFDAEKADIKHYVRIDLAKK